ncbi:DUF6223 family protein [Dactylosporangium sp. McL0621]|uniref:DUF6223 family protein n=1 Tax=Dactylosporangium sp. McL0621 TaxID=3415678 RepID=UPI003CE91867
MSVPLLTLDRVVATAGTFVALGGAITGGLALAGRLRQRGPVLALAAGAAGVVVGVLVLATADGGPGTGNGVIGGGAAIVFGLAAVVLGALARRRAIASN